MLLATITFSGIMTIIGLVLVLLLACVAFSHWISCGGILGWWMANQCFELIGLIIQAIFEAIASMRD
jgi:hypothetical protein